MHPHMRVARPTDNLEQVCAMYCTGLDFVLFGRFAGHNGFSGVILGPPGGGYHLEFTQEHGQRAGRAPTEENLLVFYVPEADAWQTRCERMEGAGFLPVHARNPYWDRLGRTFEDADGYRVVIQRAEWNR